MDVHDKKCQTVLRQIQLLNNDFQSYKFIDLGCGKGKVVIVWKKMLQKYGLEQKIKGVDYSKKLISIANQNFKKIFNCTGSFELNDVTKINFDSLGSFLIFYLYNPFNEAILNEFFSKLRPSNIIVIYNNPVHHKLLNNYGFELIFRKNGFHYNAQTIIYQKYKP